MKKLLGAVLCAALVFPSGPASAELLKNLKVGGQLDLQAVSANNVIDFQTQAAAGEYDQIGDAQTRVMLNVDWDLLDDVHSKVTLRKNDRAWGTGSQVVINGGTGVLDNTFVDQANVKIDKIIGNIDTTLGRQFYGAPGDLVVYFGPKDNLYGLAVTALDAARFDWANEHMGLTGLVGKVTSPGLGAGSDSGAVDLRGLVATCKKTGASVYAYNRVTHLSPAGGLPVANDYLYVFGVKGGYSFGNASFKGELDKNFGENRTGAAPSNYTGWAFMLNAAYKAMLGNFGLTPWGELGVGSGGASANRVFTPIAGDYRPGGIYGLFAPGATATLGSAVAGIGTVSSTSLGDRAIWGLGVKVNPSALDKLTAAISYWDYRYQTVATGASGTPAAALGNKHIGAEIDLDATWKKSENVSAGIGVGTFQPGGAIMNAQSNHRPATLARMNVAVKF